MAHSQKMRRQCAPIDDLYDYAAALPRRQAGRHAQADQGEWIVTDDWPEQVPVSEAEVDAFEAWFGDLFEELFLTRH